MGKTKRGEKKFLEKYLNIISLLNSSPSVAYMQFLKILFYFYVTENGIGRTSLTRFLRRQKWLCMPVSKKRKRKRIGRIQRWTNYQEASIPFRSHFFVDLCEVNPQMTSQILMKLLPAILGCPLSFLPPPWLTASFFVNKRCWG